MTPSIAEVLRALPKETDAAVEEGSPTADNLQATFSSRPVPVGRLRRLRLLGSLQAKIAVAYLFYWIRGGVKSAAGNNRLFAGTTRETSPRGLCFPSFI